MGYWQFFFAHIIINSLSNERSGSVSWFHFFVNISNSLFSLLFTYFHIKFSFSDGKYEIFKQHPDYIFLENAGYPDYIFYQKCGIPESHFLIGNAKYLNSFSISESFQKLTIFIFYMFLREIKYRMKKAKINQLQRFGVAVVSMLMVFCTNSGTQLEGPCPWR